MSGFGQNIGNTAIFLVTFSQLGFAVFYGRRDMVAKGQARWNR